MAYATKTVEAIKAEAESVMETGGELGDLAQALVESADTLIELREQGSEADPTTSAAHLLNYDGGTNFGIFGSAPSVEGSHPYRLLCMDLMATVFDVD